ncbi:hypothetical protein D3C76_1745110 [compost metagenome]
MIARPQVSEKRLRDRCQPGTEQASAITTFQLGDQVFEGERRRVAAGTVTEHTLMITPGASVTHLRQVVEQHGA